MNTNPSITQPKGTVMFLNHDSQLINEALSRMRMRRRHKSSAKPVRPARQIMMSSRRREQDRLLGL